LTINSEQDDAIWEEYEEIRSSEDFNAIERFVLRTDLPDDLVREILDSEGDLGILSSLASNEALKAEFLEDLYHYQGAISKEEDAGETVLYGLAGNRSVGKEILQNLAEHDNEEISELAKETLSGM
jgi:hypothetical protein